MFHRLCLLFLAIAFTSKAHWEITQHLATKSPYFVPILSKTNQPHNPNCSIQLFQLVARHGARNPTDGDVDKLEALEQIIRTTDPSIINASNFPWIFNWTSPFSSNNGGELNIEGELEHYQIAQRYREKYPILSEPYNPKNFIIQTTIVRRAAQSANAFGYGLFSGRSNGALPGGYQPFYTYSESGNQDNTLRFFDNCPAYLVAKNSSLANDQKKKYKERVYPAIAAKLLQALGSTKNWLNQTIVDAMYSACAFEVSAFRETTKWCALFDIESIEDYEFVNDLESYWQKSYGIPINYQMACLLVSDIINQMDKKLKGKAETTAYLRFAHAETVIPLIATLGLYRSEDHVMEWDAPKDVILNRKFRTSNFSSFASNVGFVLSTCSDGPKVRVISNEVPVIMPGCPSVDCPYEIFTGLLKKYIGCNFTNLCEVPQKNPQDSTLENEI